MTSTFLLISTADALKCGRRAEGSIRFQILTNPERSKIFLSMIGNQGGTGYFCPTPVDFDSIHACVSALPAGQLLTAKHFKSAAFTVSKSANGPGFVAAIVRSLGLLAPADGQPFRHVVVGDWLAWKAEQLQLPADPLPSPNDAAAEIAPTETQSEAEAPKDKRKPRKDNHAHPA